jgi:hypothetical protein
MDLDQDGFNFGEVGRCARSAADAGFIALVAIVGGEGARLRNDL